MLKVFCKLLIFLLKVKVLVMFNSLQPHGVLQARILEWVAIFFSRGSSQSRDQIWVLCIEDRFFTI